LLKLRVEIDRPEHGWLPIRFSGEGGEIDLVASYVHDSVSELIDAMLTVFDCGESAVVSFEEEPNSVELTISKRDGLLVLNFDEGRDGRTQITANFELGLRQIAYRLKNLIEDDITQYQKEWRRDAPIKNIEALWARIK